MLPQALQVMEVHADAWENTVQDFLLWKIRPVLQWWQLSLASEAQSMAHAPPGEDDWALSGE